MQYDSIFDKNERFTEIVARIAKHKKRALADFYREFGRIMFITATMNCRSGIDADEVVNQVLIKIWDNADYVMSLESPENWLYNVTKLASAALMNDPDWKSFPYDYPPRDEVFRLIRSNMFYFMIRTLSQAEQEIMIFKYVGKFTLERIAEMTRNPLNAVTAMFSGSFDKIKARIKKNFNKFSKFA